MVMPPRFSSSSGMQSIRRELQRRRHKPLAPKSSAATKPSAPPPPRPCPPIQEDPSSAISKSRQGSAGTHAPRPTAVSPSTPPPSRSTPSSVGSASRATPFAAAANLRPGTAVGVRTRTTTLKTGEALVLWLRAMIVSPAHGGYEVVYDGNWPPCDPYGTVHVPRRHVRMIKPSPSLTTTPPPSLPPSSAPSSCASVTTTATVAAARKKEMRSAPRPTTAGKSLRFIRSLLPEMDRHAQAASPGY